MRASPAVPARRSLGTTGRRRGRDFCFSTKAALCAASKTLTAHPAGGRTRSLGPPRDPRNNPCRRQGDRVVAPGSTGRRLLVEDDRGASGETPISSSPIAWRRASAARHRLTGAHARMDVAVGEGSAEPRSGRSRDGDPGLRFAPAFARVAVVGTRPDGALACRPFRASAGRAARRSQPGERSSGPGDGDSRRTGVELHGRRKRQCGRNVVVTRVWRANSAGRQCRI